MVVEEIMTRDPYAVTVNTSVRQVLRGLAETDIRHVPIVADGALVGIVSDRDLRDILPGALEGFERPRETERVLSQPIAELMSSDVICVSPEDDVADAVDLMIEHRIGAVPVVEPGGRKLVGIVSYVDALRAARELL
jgi:acetoin utilization protein AcuB